MSRVVWQDPLFGAYGRRVDAFGVAVVGSAAGVVGVLVAVVFRVWPYLQRRRAKAIRPGIRFLPAPVLDVQVRGRKDVVERLAGLALAADGRVRILAGLPGSGKSTVAQAVAARVVAAGGRAWWVPAGDAESMTSVLLGLAGELGASPERLREADARRVNPSDVLWGQLDVARGWVLVLDNVDDPAELAVGKRAVGSGSGWLRSTRAGLVLVTSRHTDQQAWGPAVAIMERLGPLEPDDGAQVLTDLADRVGGLAEARSLSARLGGLPLALHQAGSYLALPFTAEKSFAAYERALTERFGELMGRGDDDRARMPATLELSLQGLEAHGQGQARLLLQVLSCFAAMIPVPPPLLDRAVLTRLCGSQEAVEEGLSGLLSAGLIETVNDHDADSPSVLVHPLVAETTRYQAGANLPGALAIAAELVTAASDHASPDYPHDVARWLTLVPHLRALLASRTPLPGQAEESLAFTTAQISGALTWAGSSEAALAAAVAESGMRRAHGRLTEDHEAVLELRYWRAHAWERLGRHADAEVELRQLLADELQILGPDHPGTLHARHAIAYALLGQGRGAEAEAGLRQVLSDELRILGAEDPSTIATRHNIAAAMARQGKFAEAEAEFRQVLADELRIRGPGDPSTLATRNEIARTLARQGKFAEAEAEYRRVLADRQRVLGPDDPSILTTRHGIGVALAGQGKAAEAEAEYRRVLADQLRIMGADHPYTLTIQHDLAFALAKQGKTAEAEAGFRQVLVHRLRILSPDHPDTLATRDQLEHLRRETGQ